MHKSILDQITNWLHQNQVDYKLLHHEPTFTSEDSARVRNEDIAIGAKALVMKVDKTYQIFVISAARKVDAKKIRKHLSAKKTRFATADELLALTTLVPGSVPPFGRPFFDLDLYADASVFENDRVAFNAGSLTDSVIMPASDYKRLAAPIIFDFAKTDQ